jgi:enolase
MCQEHPLVTYIEDPFSDTDMEGFRKFKAALAEANLSHIKVGMKNQFKNSSL